MNAQIEQLRKEIADKQKKLETLEQFPYEKGQLVYVETLQRHVWVIEFDCIKDFEVLILYCYCLSSNNEYKGKSTLCDISEITTHRLATDADLNRLPDGHKWKPKKLPTTIKEVCKALKSNNILLVATTNTSTLESYKRVRAYNNLLNVIEWGNREWPDDMRAYSYTCLPLTNKKTILHIDTHFSNDLKTFQS